MSQSERTVLFLSFVALAVLFLTGRSPTLESVEPSVQADDYDYWQTPFYLRTNMPVEARRSYEMPQNRFASWSIGYPQPQVTLPRG